jgi:hypothetical protein
MKNNKKQQKMQRTNARDKCKGQMARTNAKDKCRGQCKGQMPRTNAKDKCPRQIMVLWMVKKHVKGIQNQTKPIWPHSNVLQSAKNVNLLKIDKDG